VPILLPAAKALVGYLPFEPYLALSRYNAEFVTLAVRWTWSSGKCLILRC